MGATAEQGSDAYDNEKPIHSVTLSDYYIGKYEVTQAQWEFVMGTSPSYFKGENLPVENIPWDDIKEFIAKLNTLTNKKFRLPTEAEWEYAARGGNQSKGYKYSGSNNGDEVAWYDGDGLSGSKTHPVGQKNPNELGIYDMSGNVSEWCQDWYGDYSSSSQTNPQGPSSGSFRVLRGGSWDSDISYCRVSKRSDVNGCGSYIGFRLVLEVEGAVPPTPDPEPDPDPTPDNCKIGDILTINGVKGVVFQTTPSVKMVSVTETTAQWSTEYVITGATDSDNGRNNMSVIKAITDWQTKYPAFKWCANIGEGWYLPALNELKAIYAQKDAINATLSANGMDEFGSKYRWLWSSSEFSNSNAYSIHFSYGSDLDSGKNDNNAVRAVLELDADGNPIADPEPEPEPEPDPTPDLSVLFGDDTMVYVKGGTFTMGATAEQGEDAGNDEKPAHSVTLSDFHIGKFEVTQAQWKAVMGSNPSKFTGNNNPVDYVSWYDVQEFIKKLNAQTGKKFRLPTEAEWEYAARGGNQSKGYKYSGSNSISEVAWYEDNSDGKTHPVGQKKPNELGIYDMSGNVHEWCQDLDGDYSSSSQINPTGPSSGSSHIRRGGSWEYNAWGCRVSYRGDADPGYLDTTIGFRLVLEP